MNKLIAAGIIILLVGLYIIVGTGSVFAEDSIQTSYVSQE